ncbi:multidrug effflux MFS transporter [Craurococcus roseus]|uniref:Bcr/CflA family efflux transporter n=1 Tax=Craurococcus roseus TaxID=77585 RepID=A0ABP3PU12_9PROT
MTALIAALTALPALSIDMGLPALPDLADAFGAGAGDAQLSIGLFLAGFAAAQLGCGPASDRFGRRPVLLAGLGLFAAAGLGCALAPSLPALFACRTLQGVGACAGTVLARAVIRDLFSGEAAVAKLSQATAIMALGPVLAPAVGAAVLAVFGWRAVFVVLGLGGLALFLAVASGLAETIPAKDRGALDQRALARNAAAFFRNGRALGNALAAAFLFGGMFAYVAASPFALMEALGVGTPGFSGLFALTALGIMAGALAGSRLVRVAGRRRVVLGGLALGATAGAVLFALALAGGPALPAVVALVALYTFARGLVVPVATASAMEPMGHAAGLASGLIGAMQMAGAALAASSVGLFGDPLVGMGATLALSGAAALACGLGCENEAGRYAPSAAAPARGR